jgi:mRNA-degrading endonuclease HigB of HigAB toxin-antitoxin module
LWLAFREDVVSRRTLKEFAAAHAGAGEELDEFTIARKGHWRSLLEVRQAFGGADQFRLPLIFNIRRSAYRLIVKALLTHKEYDRGEWKKWAR